MQMPCHHAKWRAHHGAGGVFASLYALLFNRLSLLRTLLSRRKHALTNCHANYAFSTFPVRIPIVGSDIFGQCACERLLFAHDHDIYGSISLAIIKINKDNLLPGSQQRAAFGDLK